MEPYKPRIVDPLRFVEIHWPHVSLYQQQQDVLYSVMHNDQTFVPAGNMLGKDFVSALVVLWYFITRHPCRIITTSAKDDHLRVLWGEIGNFIQTSRYPLDVKQGGQLIVNHHELRKIVRQQECKLSYAKGMVASPDSMAAMQGHHIAKTNDRVPRTLFVSDESSSVPDDYWRMASTWMDRALVIGNTWPCENFFKQAIKGKAGTKDRGGDIPRPNGKGYIRKVIRIKAEDSPNVRLALAQIKSGKEPTDEIIVPGVKPWGEYQKNRMLWDKIQQCVSLDADFYEGADVMLFPPEWLNLSETVAASLTRNRRAKALGIDAAEGGDNTALCAVDELGVVELVSIKTPDTSVVVDRALAMMHKHGIPASNVMLDSGGGGRQHADVMRRRGYNVRTVHFGEGATPAIQRKGIVKTMERRASEVETRYVYKNRRAELYGTLRDSLDPSVNKQVFAIPAEYVQLRLQLAPIPLLYDQEGRLYLPPKRKRDANDKRVTIEDLVGHSPDEADALVLARFGLVNRVIRSVAGAI